jgi:hypothetical protein
VGYQVVWWVMYIYIYVEYMNGSAGISRQGYGSGGRGELSGTVVWWVMYIYIHTCRMYE